LGAKFLIENSAGGEVVHNTATTDGDYSATDASTAVLAGVDCR